MVVSVMSQSCLKQSQEQIMTQVVLRVEAASNSAENSPLIIKTIAYSLVRDVKSRHIRVW